MTLAFSRFLLPFSLRDSDRCACLSFFSARRRNRGAETLRPSDTTVWIVKFPAGTNVPPKSVLTVRRGATVLGYLADRGVPRDQLDRVRVPAGLDLGRTTHQEIAVAILAELVQLRASGALAGAHGRGPATESARQAGPEGARPAARAALVVDPVCGMTVSADSSRPLRYEGTDYYFCCAGCRQAFEQDPDAYLKRETRC